MKCSACSFWDSDEHPARFAGDSPEHSLCMKAIVSWSDDTSPMLVEDASMYEAELYTHKDHYCSSFEKKRK